jgi:hypothetical protein
LGALWAHQYSRESKTVVRAQISESPYKAGAWGAPMGDLGGSLGPPVLLRRVFVRLQLVVSPMGR